MSRSYKWRETPEEEIETLREMVEQLQGRIAMLEEFIADAQLDAWRALDPDYVPPDVESAMKSLLHRAATITQEIDPDDIEPNAWLLHKQAEAAASAIRTALRSLGNPDLDEADIQKFAEDYVKRTYG